MKHRGRPVGSDVRNNIIDILYFLKSAYGYEIYKHYIELFPKVTLRVIYYHLTKGISMGEFKIEKIEKNEGNYSWGKMSERTIYSLGDNAKPSMNDSVKKYFQKKNN
ncbi:MAG: hypothetical protein QXG00_03605 [Candidatus Woesearchaeota archaeon]